MDKFFSFKKTGFTVVFILFSLTIFIRCVNQDLQEKNLAVNTFGQKFAGSDKCLNCHQPIYEHFEQTAHAATSEPATEQSVKGSFENHKNIFAFNYYERVIMDKTDSGMYQVALHRNVPGEAHRFDVVIGSGIRGQTYLSWNQNRLFQLPVSYYAPGNSWSGSPGYSDYSINFNRPVTARCLECHSTYAKASNFNDIASNAFEKNKIVYGISCESCHGAAAKHVEYQQQNPSDKKAKFIINPALLSRQAQLDQCGVCHSGIQKNISPSFSFTPGDTLSKYFKLDYNAANPANLDVHGNKFALLSSSKCFIKSPELTCNTCHNTHNNERNNLALFSQKCMTCHNDKKVKFCTVKVPVGVDITSNCIDCHMPEKSSSSLTMRLQNETEVTPAVLRTHKITVYPEETAKTLSFMKANGSFHKSNPH